jgi:hypothetical protein
MTRRRALTFAVLAIGMFGLIFTLLLLSKPEPAVSHASYAWKPGCHCGAPKTPATAKPKTTTATTKKPATTTTKVATKTPATAKSTTTAATKTPTATKSTTTTATKAATSTKASAATSVTKPAKTGKASTTTTSTKKATKSSKAKLSVGLLVAAALTYPDDGGSSGGSDGTNGAGGSDGTSGEGTGGDGTDGSLVNATAAGPPHYYLSPVAVAFLLAYGVSFALYRARRMRVTTHRKIWNMLLLATFLICGLVGLALAVAITRDPPVELPSWLLVWHVETGIAMCLISFFHVGWHLRYYVAIVTGKRQHRAKTPRPAVQEDAAFSSARSRRKVARPGPMRGALPRTDAERMLAFRRRQAARAEIGRGPTGGHAGWPQPLAD